MDKRNLEKLLVSGFLRTENPMNFHPSILLRVRPELVLRLDDLELAFTGTGFVKNLLAGQVLGTIANPNPNSLQFN